MSRAKDESSERYLDSIQTSGIDDGSPMSVKGTIGFAGLSHLGIIYSMASAARGFSILAFDDRRDLITDLSAGRFPVSEPGLNEAFLEHGARLRFTASAESLAEC